jgi:tetratricopeptide (TPR) repeat protein
LRLLQRAISHADYSLGARLLVGEVLVERGRHKEAAREYLQALRIADSLVVPEDKAEALSQLYDPIIAAHMEQTDEGVHKQLCSNVVELLVQPNWRKNLEKARRELPIHDPDAPPSPIAEVLTQVQSGQIVAALTSIHQHARNGFIRVAMDEAYRALDYAPTYLSLHALMGDLLIKQGRTEEASTKFTMVAKAYSARGDAIRSKELFQRILQLAPMDLETRKRLITQLVAGGDVEGALEEYMALAEVYLRLAELDTARATFADAQQLAQGMNVSRDWVVKIMHAIADIDQQRLDWRRALQIFIQIRELAPGDLKARLSIIDLNLKMGQEPKAIQELDKFLTFLQRDGDIEKTLDALNSLAAMSSDNSTLLERIARMYQSMDRGAEAVKQWDKLGELALTTGDQQLAIRSVQAIIALNPPNIEDYKLLLEELRG